MSVVGEKPTLFRPGHITLEDLERALGEEVEVSKAILEKLPEGAVVRSPGMKYKHYAPKADVTLLDGTFEQFKAYASMMISALASRASFTISKFSVSTSILRTNGAYAQALLSLSDSAIYLYHDLRILMKIHIQRVRNILRSLLQILSQ